LSSNAFSTREAATATSGVVEGLTRAILADFKPGDRLDSEAELAQRFGVSRVTLREALRTLAGKGLVELSRGKRAVVRQPDASSFGDYLASVIEFDPKGMFDLVEVRQSLEVQSVTLAAQRISRAGLVALEGTLQGMREAAAEYDAGGGAEAERKFHRHDVGFHEALAMASGNRVLISLFEAMALPLEKSFAMSRQGRERRGHTSQATLDAHQRIFECVREGSAKAAAEAMRAHLEDAERDMRAMFNIPAERLRP
jgi:GntR family transcriptional regulator, transcriptional repressor for pyruvate dehydrogenase complex